MASHEEFSSRWWSLLKKQRMQVKPGGRRTIASHRTMAKSNGIMSWLGFSFFPKPRQASSTPDQSHQVSPGATYLFVQSLEWSDLFISCLAWPGLARPAANRTSSSHLLPHSSKEKTPCLTQALTAKSNHRGWGDRVLDQDPGFSVLSFHSHLLVDRPVWTFDLRARMP